MKAIQTRYLGPTDNKGARIKVEAEGCGSIQRPYDDALSLEENHQAAMMAFALNLGWNYDWVGGSLPNGDFAWVRLPQDS